MDVILLVIHLILAISLVVVVLLQRSEGGALGIGGGGGGGAGGGMFTARGSANLLTRATAVLATLFFCTSLALAIVSGDRSEPTSVIDAVPSTQAPAAESTEPTIPATE